MKTSKTKKILLSAISIVLLWTIVGLALTFRLNVNMYTTEQHINRISKQLEKTYIIKSGEYTDYKIYPLYKADGDVKYEYSLKNWLGINEKHKKRYFLVEFEPKGFEIVKAEGEMLFGMYKSHLYGVWSRYRISEERPDDSDGIYWEQIKDNMGRVVYEEIWHEYDDEKNEIVVHFESPYRAANIGQEEKRYLLPIGGTGDRTSYFVPAIKRGDKFLNLISMEEFYYDPNATHETTPYINVTYHR